MKIIGKELAFQVYEEMKGKLLLLNERGIVPKLVIIKSMDIDAVNNYIHQKVKRGKKVGVDVEVVEIKENECNDKNKIKETISKINNSSQIHGIIFQKPGNKNISEEMEYGISLDKDVDGFLNNSSHKPPVYRGVLKVLESIYNKTDKDLIAYLQKKKIVLIGKGKTGGGTIISGLTLDGFNMDLLHIIDSKTSTSLKTQYLNQADIIISAVGKVDPVDFHTFHAESILIDIGVHFDEENKIKGDFNEDDIKDRVAYYTTTPGGLGVLTVAYLMDNTVNAALKSVIHSSF